MFYADDDPCRLECCLTYIGERELRAVLRLVVEEPVGLTERPASAGGITGTWEAADHINTFNIELYKVSKL